jgi:Zn-dependent protease
LEDFSGLLLFLPVLLFSVVAHEYAHGYAALKQGDPTAYQLGRLTFNPIKHIDPVMTILVPALLFMTAGFMFGGAKPVPVNPRNYRNYKRGDIIVSMAGIATNIVLAFVCALLAVPVGILGRSIEGMASMMGILQHMLVIGIQVNLILAIFNLLPIPPLDGSHVMKYLLPPAWSLRYQAIGGAGIIILILMLTFFRGVLFAWMTPAFIVMDFLFLSIAGYRLPLP